MKSKLIRLFAVVASVLVLVGALVVPMSADSFDSSNPLIEDQWTYITIITFSDLTDCDLSFSYSGPLYIIFSINGDRYSLAGGFAGFDSSDQHLAFSRQTIEQSYPSMNYYYGSGHLVMQNNSDSYFVDRYYNVDSDLEIVIYSNEAIAYTGSYGFEMVTSEVEPSSTRITSVFTNIMDWITSGLNSVQGVFYANNQLTMIGTLAVIGVAIAVAFLLVGVLQRFLHLRG